MNRNILSILAASIIFLVLIGGAVAGTTQKIVTVSVPKDYHSAEAYKVEFTVPEGSMAFNFTLWGVDKTWGIVDISGGAYKEIYSSRNKGLGGDTPMKDAESSERIIDPTETDSTDPLARLTIYSGSYIVWMEGKPGESITLQYNLQTMR